MHRNLQFHDIKKYLFTGNKIKEIRKPANFLERKYVQLFCTVDPVADRSRRATAECWVVADFSHLPRTFSTLWFAMLIWVNKFFELV